VTHQQRDVEQNTGASYNQLELLIISPAWVVSIQSHLACTTHHPAITHRPSRFIRLNIGWSYTNESLLQRDVRNKMMGKLHHWKTDEKRNKKQFDSSLLLLTISVDKQLEHTLK